MGYLSLLNLPLLFTALADVVAGYIVVTSLPGMPPTLGAMFLLLVASGCLFGAGAVSRACFEFEDEDAVAPEGPLQRGEATLKGAFVLATVFAVVGVLSAMLVGKTTVCLAWALLFTHWLHGGYLRDFDVTGSLAVGATRLLNIMMGMSAGEEFIYAMKRPSLRQPVPLLPLQSSELLLPVAILLVYVVLISIIGRLRTEGGTRFTLLASGAGVLVTLVAAAVYYWPRSLFAVMLLMLVAAAVAAPMMSAVARLSPRSIGRVVMVGTLAAVLLDASFIFGSQAALGDGWAVTVIGGVFTMALLVPAVLAWKLVPSATAEGMA